MLKRLQERINEGTEEADADSGEEGHGERSGSLADEQLELEEITRKIAERLAAAAGESAESEPAPAEGE